MATGAVMSLTGERNQVWIGESVNKYCDSSESWSLGSICNFSDELNFHPLQDNDDFLSFDHQIEKFFRLFVIFFEFFLFLSL